MKIAIETDRLWIGREPPFGSAEEDRDVSRVQLDDARRDTTCFHGLVDGSENNVAIPGHMNNYSSAREVGYDFIFAFARLSSSA